MVRFAITPWRTQSDLLQVRQQLYNLTDTGTDTRRHAVDRVMAWKLRGNLPHAVESTALLLDASLHYEAGGNSTFSVRAVYSAAFCRFVTGFCDIGRAKERMLEPSSMLDIAKQIGMPVEFVALRHEATHEELPGVGRLVAASQQALAWLWKVYWTRLEEPETAELMAADLSQVKGEAKKAFKEYRSQRREILQGKKPGATAAHLEEQLRVTGLVCRELVGRSRVKIDALAEVLVDDKLLVPSNREFGSPMGGAFLIWDELIGRLAREYDSFLLTLVGRMFDIMRSDSTAHAPEDTEAEATYLWLMHLVSDEHHVLMPEAEKDLRAELMKWCCLYPGHWARISGQELLGGGDEQFQDCWEELFEASKLQEHNLSVDASSNGWTMLVDPTDISSRRARVEASGDQDEDARGGWVRTAIAAGLPIGVV